MRRIIYILLVALITMTSCGDRKPDSTEVVVLFTTDVYGFIFPYDFQNDDDTRAGVANFATLVREQRAIYGDRCIVLDNGNKLPGGPASFYYNIVDTISEPLCYRSERLIGYDVVNLGNRDPEVSECFRMKRHDPSTLPPLVCANLLDTRTGKPYLQPYEILERDGLTIAVIGFVSPLLTSWLSTSEWKFLETQDMIESATYWMKEVQEKHHPDIVIGLCSCNIHYDAYDRNMDTYKNPNGGIPIGMRVPGFDLILMGCGHERTVIEETNDAGQHVTFIQSGRSNTHVGQARIQMERQKDGTYQKRVFATTLDLKQFQPDPDFCQALQPARDSIYNWFNRPVGYLRDSIIGEKGLYGPDFYRDFINTAQLWWSGADISFASLLMPSNHILEGPLSMRSIFEIYPFEHEPHLLKMLGEDVRRYLEWSIDLQYETMTSPKDPMVRLRKDPQGHIIYNEDGAPYLANDPTFFTAAGGIHYTADLRKPQGQRVEITTMMDGTPFDSRKEYTVFINSYQYHDGGKFISEGLRWDDATLALHDLPLPFTSMRQVLCEYVQHIDTVEFSYRYEWGILPKMWWVEAKLREQDIVPQPRWK